VYVQKKERKRERKKREKEGKRARSRHQEREWRNSRERMSDAKIKGPAGVARFFFWETQQKYKSFARTWTGLDVCEGSDRPARASLPSVLYPLFCQRLDPPEIRVSLVTSDQRRGRRRDPICKHNKTKGLRERALRVDVRLHRSADCSPDMAQST